ASLARSTLEHEFLRWRVDCLLAQCGFVLEGCYSIWPNAHFLALSRDIPRRTPDIAYSSRQLLHGTRHFVMRDQDSFRLVMAFSRSELGISLATSGLSVAPSGLSVAPSIDLSVDAPHRR